MKPVRRTYKLASASVLIGCSLFLFLADSCENIEFEPIDLLYITTDSISSSDKENYRLTGTILNIGENDILQHGFCWSDTGTPTIANSVVTLGEKSAVGKFSSIISGLELKTTYFVRAYAETDAGISYGNEKYFRSRPPDIPPVIEDYDGNVYKVVVIGQQAWMAENLRTTHYADGSPIPLVEDAESWNAMTANDKAYSWYNNDPDSTESYGAYYTWAAAMNGAASSNANPSNVQGVCPDGWHLPSDVELNQLQVFLGMNPNDGNNVGFLGTRQRIGRKLKGIGVPLWEQNLSYSEINESGFTALPVGLRTNTGDFLNVGKYTYFWTSSQHDNSAAWYRYLQRGHAAILRVFIDKTNGFSVRCTMDL